MAEAAPAVAEPADVVVVDAQGAAIPVEVACLGPLFDGCVNPVADALGAFRI